MKDKAVASRYAEALFLEAKSANKLDIISANMRNLSEILDNNHDLNNLIKCEAIDYKEKLLVINKIGALFDALVHGLLVAMTSNGRLDALQAVIDSFDKIVHEYKDEVVVDVTYSAPVDGATRAELVSHLEGMTGKKVILKEVIEPELIGGLKVCIGSVLYDASIRGKLTALKSQLIK